MVVTVGDEVAETGLWDYVGGTEGRTEGKGLLERTRPAPAVAAGIGVGTKVSLYLITHSAGRQASVLVYPSSIDLGADEVKLLDGRYESGFLMEERKFNDRIPEDTSREILARAGRVSTYDYYHKFRGITVADHVFPDDDTAHLARVIRELGD